MKKLISLAFITATLSAGEVEPEYNVRNRDRIQDWGAIKIIEVDGQKFVVAFGRDNVAIAKVDRKEEKK